MLHSTILYIYQVRKGKHAEKTIKYTLACKNICTVKNIYQTS